MGARGDLVGKVQSSVDRAMEHALALDPADGSMGVAASYASALRCRLEIQYALLLIQRGLSIELKPAKVPRRGTGDLVEGLRADLSRAASLLREGSVEGAGAALMVSDAEVAGVISSLRRVLKGQGRARTGPAAESSPGVRAGRGSGCERGGN